MVLDMIGDLRGRLWLLKRVMLLQDDRLVVDWVPTEDTRELEESERETRQ